MFSERLMQENHCVTEASGTASQAAELKYTNKAGLTRTKYREQTGTNGWKASAAKIINGKRMVYIPWVLTRECGAGLQEGGGSGERQRRETL